MSKNLKELKKIFNDSGGEHSLKENPNEQQNQKYVF